MPPQFDPAVIGAIVRAARASNLDPAAMLATAYAESGLRPGAVNPSSGASGLFQFLPSTFRGLGGTGSMTDPTQNANLAALGMAQAGARGLRGQAALEKMLTGFERPGPAGVRSDLSRALPFMAQAQQLAGHAPDASASPPGAPPPSGGTGAPTLGGSLSPGALAAFMRYLTQSQQQVAAGKAPTDPFSGGLLQKLLAGVRSPGGTQQAAELPAQGAPAGTLNIGGLVYPLPKQAPLIGRPYQGTHLDFGNWQSDRAWDLAADPNTPVYAVTGGTVDPRFGSLGSQDPHLAGLRMTLDAPQNAYYYQHLRSFAPGIKPGARVTPGQLLGYTGALNHLHFAAQSGDPFGLPGLPAGR